MTWRKERNSVIACIWNVLPEYISALIGKTTDHASKRRLIAMYAATNQHYLSLITVLLSLFAFDINDIQYILSYLCIFTAFDACASNPCENGAGCFRSSGDCSSFFCDCPSCFTGPTCGIGKRYMKCVNTDRSFRSLTCFC